MSVTQPITQDTAAASARQALDRLLFAGESQALGFKARFDQAMKFIVSYITIAFEFDGSVQRKERFAYPLPALREALLNAVVHRDYTDGSDIQVKIFDKQITIFSPGTFYGKLTVADVQAENYRSSLRNKLVAEGFYLVHAIEKYGSGFIRIRKALLEYPEVEFTVQEKFGGVLASFTQLENQAGPESEGVNTFLKPITDQPGLRGPALATLLDTSPKSVERWLTQLKAAEQIQFTGACQNRRLFSDRVKAMSLQYAVCARSTLSGGCVFLKRNRPLATVGIAQAAI